MKIAICLNGLVGGLAGRDGVGHSINPEIGYSFYKEALSSYSEFDSFIHTWSIDQKDKIVETYQPKASQFENQISFSPWTTLKHQAKDFDDLLPIIKKEKNLINAYSKIKTLAYRAQSRWYSTYKSIALMEAYEKEHGFTYDAVILTRFDLALFKKLDFDQMNLSNFIISPREEFKHTSFTAEPTNKIKDIDRAIEDLIFISNSENIKNFGKLYLEINNYSIRPPFAALQRLKDLNIKTENSLDRWLDYTLIRNSFFH